ncbi:hypothetical protein WDW89_26080 [Deltaproteobacteria bacterium TL4]
MNAIYDAPIDVHGKHIYNHLLRTEEVHLKKEEYSRFRYACDAMFLALSVEDPFGGFNRQTVLDYLEACYSEKRQQETKDKGGAGIGLYQMWETADLIVINVKPSIKTEVIAIFEIDAPNKNSSKSKSFHYFYG